MLADKSVQEGEAVEIKRQFPVTRAALFHAWTNPKALKVWFGPAGVETRLAEVDLRVGGKYRVEMVLPDGEVVAHHGKYEEIVPPEKLVFTWLLRDQACEGSAGEQVETRVTILFKVVDDETTELILLHEGLPSQKSREQHSFGWTGCFDCLLGYIVATARED